MKRINNLSRGKMLIIMNKVPFFKAFTSFEREKIVDTDAAFYVAHEDEFVIEQGTLDTAFYILLSGHARVMLEGNQTVLARLEPGEFFGEIAFIQNVPRTSHVIAEETCILFKVDRRLLGSLNADIREKFKDQVIIKLANMVTKNNKVPPESGELHPDLD
ncbi:cyclic nucleotide-binding domain-containing protein [Bermanella sp. R86510]|uniref:cyclic nucleotide-binding domain-containing protein n=1 Tax=unclassified Bermanella TaxID=2627862 RepID=UPI0037C78DD0